MLFRRSNRRSRLIASPAPSVRPSAVRTLPQVKRDKPAAVSAADALEPRTLLSAVTIDAAEQYFVELINRTRQNPAAEATRLGIDLNADIDLLSGDTLTAEARQILASNQILSVTADLHTGDMLANNYFAHIGLDLSTPSQRAQREGYDGVVGENLAWFGTTGTVATGQAAVDALHLQLWDSVSHRRGMLEDDIRTREVGIGLQFGTYTTAGNDGVIRDYNAAMVTELFGKTNAGRIYITGVAYEDAASGAGDDDFYSIGEGLSGGVVIARDTTTGQEYTGELNSAGGYNVLVPDDATYEVRLVDDGDVYTHSELVAIDAWNAKVDFDLSELTPDAADTPTDGFGDIIGRETTTGSWWLARSNGDTFENIGLGGWSKLNTYTDVFTGDFDGDGTTDIAGRDQNGAFTVSLLTDDVLRGESHFTTSIWGVWSDIYTWSEIQVGDFNGDGRDDILGRASENGNWYLGESTGLGFVTSRIGRLSRNFTWVDLTTGDFNNDGTVDIAARNVVNGEWWIGMADNTDDTTLVNTYYGRFSPNATWRDIQTGDFDGNGQLDIIGRVDGRNEMWVAENDGTRFTAAYYGRFSTAVDWANFTVGNFTGDGADDILARNVANGRLVVGTATNGEFLFDQFGTWSRDVQWIDVTAIDFDGNGYDDLAGRTTRTGSWWVALSDGQTSTNKGVGFWSRSHEWTHVTGGDFDAAEAGAAAYWQESDEEAALDALAASWAGGANDA